MYFKTTYYAIAVYAGQDGHFAKKFRQFIFN